MPRPIPALALLLCALKLVAAEPRTVVWKIDDPAAVAGAKVEKVGAPRVVDGAVAFDGKADGLLRDGSPLSGCKAYTIEILFNPDADGPTDHDQKLLHVQEVSPQTQTRALMEVSLHPGEGWSAHCGVKCYLPGGKSSDKWLWDRNHNMRHPTGRWYWLAMTWDGKSITSFVDGKQEFSVPVELIPIDATARSSIGIRLTKVDPFKGRIREMRFTDAALPAEKLQHAP